jgi:hypothetical protein
MRVPASAYAALGLEPGADRAAVEQAYRRLIKLHHPDRSGGDASRAAEINRAYFELRRQHEAEPPEPEVRVRRSNGARHRKRRRRSSSGKLWPVLILSVAALLLIGRERVVEQVPRWIAWLADAPVPESGRGSAARADSSALDGPLSEPAIGGSIEQAVRLTRSGDEEELAQLSRSCHRAMRSNPELAQLDRCAAFDIAAVALADRDPISDRGAFSASAVTSRLMNAGRLLSSDYLAIERRLDRVRTAVELTLTPPAPLPPPPIVVDEEQQPAEALPDGA